jgi:hypothetical protein
MQAAAERSNWISLYVNPKDCFPLKTVSSDEIQSPFATNINNCLRILGRSFLYTKKIPNFIVEPTSDIDVKFRFQMKYRARKLILFKTFEVITAVLLKIQPLCDIMPYRVVDTNPLKDSGVSETSVTLYQSTWLKLQKALILRFRLITLWYTRSW